MDKLVGVQKDWLLNCPKWEENVDEHCPTGGKLSTDCGQCIEATLDRAHRKMNLIIAGLLPDDEEPPRRDKESTA